VQDIKALFVTRIRKWWCYYYAFISPNILREKVHRLPHRLQHLTACTGSFVYGATTQLMRTSNLAAVFDMCVRLWFVDCRGNTAHVKFGRRFQNTPPISVVCIVSANRAHAKFGRP
jgi:hypothetical protein